MAATRPGRRAPFALGVSYYPLVSESESAEDAYARDPSPDFDTFAAADIGLVRVFVSWRALEPQVGQYDDGVEERFDALVSAARVNQLLLVVALFGDDRLSEMSAVQWGKGRDPRTDAYLVQREAAMVQRIVGRYRGEAAIFAWELADEAFCSGFRSSDDLERWVRTLREAVREVDAERPILLSVDAETLFEGSGTDARTAIDTCEAASSHTTWGYRAYAAPGPPTTGASTYLGSFLLRSAARGLPVLVDGAGPDSLDLSPAEEAACVRTALYSALANRAAGVILARDRDVVTARRQPYFRDPFEVLVGLADADGTPKPSFAEVRAFAEVIEHADLRRHALAPERAAILLPAERYEPLPSLAGLHDPRACLQSYVVAKQAHVPVRLVREGDPLGDCRLLIVPSARRLADATWVGMADLVRSGGSVILSYAGGDAHPALREVFGVEFLGDEGPRPELLCRVAQAGELGWVGSFDSPLGCDHYALLNPAGASVIATDQRGAPLLTLQRRGKGAAVLVAAPLERTLAQGDALAGSAPVGAMLRAVYGAVADKAGCGSPVGCDSPHVEVALFAGDEDDLLLLLNHCARKLSTEVAFSRVVARAADVRSRERAQIGGVAFRVPLAANGGAVLRIEYA